MRERKEKMVLVWISYEKGLESTDVQQQKRSQYLSVCSQSP
jgi:hypothetical protein